MILVDLQKAFDTLDYGNMLVSGHLQLNGLSLISQKETFWFCNDVFSEAGTLKYGGFYYWTTLFSIFSLSILAGSYLYAVDTLTFYQN